eukprot:m.248508 g.248508  ORF g.248508 m.248508 type:complete len:76 (-) comp59773_c0_seq1:127-354(-)
MSGYPPGGPYPAAYPPPSYSEQPVPQVYQTTATVTEQPKPATIIVTRQDRDGGSSYCCGLCTAGCLCCLCQCCCG